MLYCLLFTVLPYNIDKELIEMFNNEKLKECRKQAGYTQLDMARLIGVARTTYAEYEQGKIQPPIDKVQKILRSLPMLRGELVEGVDDILINDDQITLIQAKNMREPISNEAQVIREVLKVLDDIDTIVKDSPLRTIDEELILALTDNIRKRYFRRAIK